MTNNDISPNTHVATTSSTHDRLEISEKLKVLCLHGYRQNGESFKNKLGSFRKYVNKYVDFVFITAPHQAPAIEANTDPSPYQKSWWANKDDGTFKGTNKNGPAFGFQESLKHVEDVWKNEGPFQGLLGFSQGACFVGLLCGLAKKKLTSIKPQFAIMSSGFVSGSLVHKSIYEDQIPIPSLHIYGTADELTPQKMSQELMSHFKNPDIVKHSGGHHFPATSEQKQAYIHFFQDRLQEYLENIELNSCSSNAIFANNDDNDAPEEQNEKMMVDKSS